MTWRTGLAAAAVALTLTLAGCGSGSGSGSAASSASSATSAAPISASDLSAKIVAATKAKGRVAATISADGNSLGEMRMNTAAADPQMAMKMSLGGMTLEMVLVDKTLYMKGLPTTMTGGKPWVKIDPNGTDAFSQQMSKALDQSNDPAAMAKLIEGATVTKVGEVDGVTHYSVKVPTTDYTKTLAMTLPKDQADALVKTLGDTVTVEYWVDADFLPQKVSVSQLQTTIEYHDWGTAAEIVAPPAAEVGSLSPDVLKQLA